MHDKVVSAESLPIVMTLPGACLPRVLLSLSLACQQASKGRVSVLPLLSDYDQL